MYPDGTRVLHNHYYATFAIAGALACNGFRIFWDYGEDTYGTGRGGLTPQEPTRANNNLRTFPIPFQSLPNAPKSPSQTPPRHPQ